MQQQQKHESITKMFRTTRSSSSSGNASLVVAKAQQQQSSSLLLSYHNNSNNDEDLEDEEEEEYDEDDRLLPTIEKSALSSSSSTTSSLQSSTCTTEEEQEEEQLLHQQQQQQAQNENSTTAASTAASTSNKPWSVFGRSVKEFENEEALQQALLQAVPIPFIVAPPPAAAAPTTAARQTSSSSGSSVASVTAAFKAVVQCENRGSNDNNEDVSQAQQQQQQETTTRVALHDESGVRTAAAAAEEMAMDDEQDSAACTSSHPLPCRGPLQKTSSSGLEDDDAGGGGGGVEKESDVVRTEATVATASSSTCSCSDEAAAPPAAPAAALEIVNGLDWKIQDYDAHEAMYRPQTIQDELKRLQALQSYMILDKEEIRTSRESSFHRLTNMACRIFNVPMAIVALVDLGRLWFLAETGLNCAAGVNRQVAFCSHAILAKEDLFVVTDASTDARFMHNPSVTGPMGIRFYASHPLQSPEGYRLGTFCIVDTKPWPLGLSEIHKDHLRDMTALVMDALTTHRTLQQQQTEIDVGKARLASASHDLMTPLTGIKLSLSLLQDYNLDHPPPANHSSSSEEDDENDSRCNGSSSNSSDNDKNDNNNNNLAESRKGRVSRRRRPQQQQQHWNDFQHECVATAVSCTNAIEHVCRQLRCRVPPPPQQEQEQQLLHNPDMDLLLHNMPTQQQEQLSAKEEDAPFDESALCQLKRAVVKHKEREVRSQRQRRHEKSSSASSSSSSSSSSIRMEVESGSLCTESPACNRSSVNLTMVNNPARAAVSSAASTPSASSASPVVHVKALMERLDQMLQAMPKQVPLILHVDPRVPDMVVGDELMIFRAALNLTVYSCQRSVTGAVRFSVRVGTSEDAMDNNDTDKQPSVGVETPLEENDLIFECEDSGPMLTREEQERLLKTPDMDSGSSGSSNNNHHDNNNNNEGVAAAAASMSSLASSLPLHSKDTVPAAAAAGEDMGAVILRSMAAQIRSVGGDFGVTVFPSSSSSQQQDYDGITTRFWFRIPLLLPDSLSSNSVAAMSPVDKKDNKTSPVSPRASADESSSTLSTVTEQESPHVKDSRKGGSRQRRALVVDDSIVVRKTMVRALARLGYDAKHAEHGMEGLEQMQQSTFDLVLCDFLMPVMDGLDLVREYRTWEKEFRPGFRQFIVGMSAHASSKDIERAMNLGMNTYRPKPIVMQELKDLQQHSDAIATTEYIDNIEDGLSKDAKQLPAKRQRTEFDVSMTPGTPSNSRVCLIASPPRALEALVAIVEAQGWQAQTATCALETMNFLKKRNWGAVLVDDSLPDMPGVKCIQLFRDWEQHNRVHRQQNLFLMSAGLRMAATDKKTSSSSSEQQQQRKNETSDKVHLPPGVSGVVCKPVSTDGLEMMLKNAQNMSISSQDSIVIR